MKVKYIEFIIIKSDVEHRINEEIRGWKIFEILFLSIEDADEKYQHVKMVGRIE